MVKKILRSAVAWTFMSLLFAWRFLWVSPYNAIAASSRKLQETRTSHGSQCKNPAEPESRGKASRRDRSGVVQKRLSKVEGEIQLLRAQIAGEKAAWESRFLELQRRQQELREQLASETFLRAGVFLKDDPDDDGGVKHHRRRRMTEMTSVSIGSLSGSQVSLASSIVSIPHSAMSTNISVASSRSSAGPHRVFVPHSPLDLQIGHRVRVLLPTGRISSGTLRYLGPLAGGRDFHLGVELESPSHGQNDTISEDQCYFKCKPGYGAFVTFDKLLMAWE